MTDDPTPIQVLIGKWESLSDFAQDAGISYGAAKQIRRRSSIPVDYWPALLDSERGRLIGLTAEDLMRLHASEKADAA